MEIEIPLDKMTISDKLRAMEIIWDDLQRTPENVPSPAWHAEILAARKKRVEEKTSKFMDWDEAKRNIRETLK